MELDLPNLADGEAYKFLTAVVVPRPIAWVTSIDAQGAVNLAPFSFFNVVGVEPPVIVLGIGTRGSGEPKDSFRNISAQGEFVVNMVPHAAREVMNGSAAEFPAGESEVAVLGLETTPAKVVRAPRLVISPVHLECRLAKIVEIGDNRVILAEIVHAHIDDAFYDPARGYVATERLDLIGRMHGRGGYVRTRDALFDMPRLTPEQVRKAACQR